MQYKSIVLVDGENLVMRYQESLKKGRTPKEGVIHIEDTFVWHPHALSRLGGKDIVRIAYYTTVVGDDKKVDEVKKIISEAEFEGTLLNGNDWYGTLVPHVYKKNKKSTKTKSVDINLTIDALRYAYGESIDQVVLMSGDGDYVPLLREIMARGKMVQACAFLNGLNNEIRYNVDDFMDADDSFFESENLEDDLTQDTAHA